MRILGVIPSRWGSTRFPGKSIALIGGKPLVLRVAEACLKAKTFDEIIVATDDTRIADALGDCRVRVVMTRADHASGTDRVAEAANPQDDDIIVNIQGDEPLIEPSLLDAVAAKLVNDDRWQMSTACAPIRTTAELEAKTVVKIVLDKDDGAIYFSRFPIPYKREGAPDLTSGLYQRHIGIYGYRGAFLKRFVSVKPCAIERSESLEQLRALWIGGKIGVVRTDSVGIGVDCPADVAAIEKILLKRGEIW